MIQVRRTSNIAAVRRGAHVRRRSIIQHGGRHLQTRIRLNGIIRIETLNSSIQGLSWVLFDNLNVLSRK